MQRDVEYFHSKMSKIDGSGNIGERLLELVKGKTIAAEAKEQASGKASSSSDSTEKSDGA